MESVQSLAFFQCPEALAAAMTETDSAAIAIHGPALVVLCGISASGKSSFARNNFLPTQIVSSDACRAVLSDDPSDQRISGKAFELFHWIIGERLRLGRVTVADSTALSKRARMTLLNLAREHNRPAILLLFDTDIAECLRRDELRDHPVGRAVIEAQHTRLRQALRDIQTEEWDEVVFVKPAQQTKAGRRVRLGPFDLRHERGPFDVIGDVHGCTEELLELVSLLGYKSDGAGGLSHPEGRKLIFLGDLADRGPHNAEAFALAMDWVRSGNALYTPGNHCNKLMRYLQGRRVTQSNGLDLTVADVEALEKREPGYKASLSEFISEAPTYLWLDGGALVVAHGGIKAGMLGRDDRFVQTMCLYGDITGKNNPDGTPVRLDWAAHYRGEATVVYGHTPAPQPVWRNNTINIDQGCVFGGRLTALRWPGREVVQVQAHAVYDPSKEMPAD